jgi:hypothetical protein
VTGLVLRTGKIPVTGIFEEEEFALIYIWNLRGSLGRNDSITCGN